MDNRRKAKKNARLLWIGEDILFFEDKHNGVYVMFVHRSSMKKRRMQLRVGSYVKIRNSGIVGNNYLLRIVKNEWNDSRHRHFILAAPGVESPPNGDEWY